MAKPIKAAEWKTLSDSAKQKKREKKVTERTGEVRRGEAVHGGGHASLQSDYNQFAAAHRVAADREKDEQKKALAKRAQEARRRRAADLADPQREQNNAEAMANFKKQRQLNDAYIRMGLPEEADRATEMDFANMYVETDQERAAYSRRKRVQELYKQRNKK